eukprot:3453560-Rhodomonas_salina.3
MPRQGAESKLPARAAQVGARRLGIEASRLDCAPGPTPSRCSTLFAHDNHHDQPEKLTTLAVPIQVEIQSHCQARCPGPGQSATVGSLRHSEPESSQVNHIKRSAAAAAAAAARTTLVHRHRDHHHGIGVN